MKKQLLALSLLSLFTMNLGATTRVKAAVQNVQTKIKTAYNKTHDVVTHPATQTVLGLGILAAVVAQGGNQTDFGTSIPSSSLGHNYKELWQRNTGYSRGEIIKYLAARTAVLGAAAVLGAGCLINGLAGLWHMYNKEEIA